MSRILVTGGAGFIGSAIVRALARRGEEVVVLAKNSTDLGNLEGLPLKIVLGDVCHRESLRDALRGIDFVYHAASIYQFYPWWKKKIAPIYKVNIKGTLNMLTAAREANVKRFVYTSSIITIGKGDGKAPSDETTPLAAGQLSSHYARTKYSAELHVLAEARKGFPAVVVNPGMVFGERDAKPTPTGEVVLNFLRRSYPGYLDTIWPVADVEDVAEAHLEACMRGRIGERYILANDRPYSMKEIFGILEKISGVRAPRIRIPHPLLTAFVYTDEWTCQWVRHRPILSSEGVKFCRLFLRTTSRKATRELGFMNAPIEASLERAVRWYRDHRYC